MADLPAEEAIEFGVRAFARATKPKPPTRQPSGWTLTFDTETTVDAAQQLRVGSFQVREEGALRRLGLFYDPASLNDREREVLYRYALDRQLDVLEVDDFIEQVFFPILVDVDGTCVGFNLPFDLSRLAIRHDLARSPGYRGGFSFVLSTDPAKPRVQIRHLNSAESLIRFTLPARQDTPRGMRKRGLRSESARGWFCDVHTLAAALLEHRGDLRSLAALLGTPTQKGEVDFDGAELTPEFIDYAIDDVQVTWETYERLAAAYSRMGLVDTPLPKIYSAASIGKAHLDAMGIRPWTAVQPTYPPIEIGHMLASYFGGRSEVHLRLQVRQVLYADFLSMYPTVCALMGLWRYVIAIGIHPRDVTAEIQKLIDTVVPEDLQRPETWRTLAVLVQLDAEADLLPARGKYDGAGYTIGLNHVSTHGQQVWYPLADVLVAATRGNRRPRIARAITYEPGPDQPDLKTIDLMGNPDYRVDPATDDVFRRMVELRSELKRRRNAARAKGDRLLEAHLDAEQHALKIIVNAMSYGIFIELNVTDVDSLQPVGVFGRGEPFARQSHSLESPGRVFHPLLATLITAGARLMLALAEHEIATTGLDWAFCDTDSMAIARPDGVSEAEFLSRATAVVDWFEPLKPYAIDEPLFKLEDANYALGPDGKPASEVAPLYCFAVSDKRYALFNLGIDGRPILRKASGHGLGHLRPPYNEEDAPASIPAPLVALKDLGVPRWQHDLWYRIIEAAVDGHRVQVNLDGIPGLDAPAVSRYAATTPELLSWFGPWNDGKPYRQQVRPFGFLLAFQAGPSLKPVLIDPDEPRPGRRQQMNPLEAPAVVAPYSTDPSDAAQHAFNRETGEPVGPERLLTYREALAQYHLHPERKFHGGDYLDAGPTMRRHVRPLGPINNIGKEANRWEEQFYIGADPRAQVDYGFGGADLVAYAAEVRGRARQFGVRELSREARVSVGTVSGFVRGKTDPRVRIVRAVDGACQELGRRRRKAPDMEADTTRV